jgi:hypothetical protein
VPFLLPPAIKNHHFSSPVIPYKYNSGGNNFDKKIIILTKQMNTGIHTKFRKAEAGDPNCGKYNA